MLSFSQSSGTLRMTTHETTLREEHKFHTFKRSAQETFGTQDEARENSRYKKYMKNLVMYTGRPVLLQ
jgi:hypothetical protein